jgi:hypothetical protein
MCDASFSKKSRRQTYTVKAGYSEPVCNELSVITYYISSKENFSISSMYYFTGYSEPAYNELSDIVNQI